MTGAADWKVTVVGHAGKRPEEFPSRRPPSARFVCSSVASWSPANSSIDRYHLSRSKSGAYWILWHGYFDDNEEMKWITAAVAYCPDPGVQPKTAAFFLMLGFLGAYETVFDNFMEMSEGLVTREEVRAMELLVKARPRLTGEKPPSRKLD